MATPKDWRIADSAEDWMRGQEKRMMHEERRPRITRAADLLGPGFGPYATEVTDWSSESARFNGFFYCGLGSANSPDGTKRWMGLVIGAPDGHGVQMVWSYDPASTDPSLHYTRTFRTPAGTITLYTAWSLDTGSGGGGGGVEFVEDPSDPGTYIVA